MRRSPRPEDSGVVFMDRASAAGRKTFEGVGYRLAAGGLGHRWTPSGEPVEEPCLEDEFVAHTARAWTRMRGLAARLPVAARAGVSAASGQVERVNIAAVCQVTAVCALAAIGASTALYWQKSRTAKVDHDIGHVAGELANAQAQTGRLRAQWLALNDPARLQDAAARYSGLRPLAPAQFVDAGKLADRLPAPGAVPADGGVDAVPEAAVAGDAMPVFKPVTAQAASMVEPAAPVDAVSHPQAAAADDAGPGVDRTSGDAAPAKPASAPQMAAHPAAVEPTRETAREPVQAGLPHAHPSTATRLAASASRVPAVSGHPATPAIIRAANASVRVAPADAHAPAAHALAAHAPPTHDEAKPHAPRMLMARYDMPRWLLETHAPRPAPIVMSAPPHALTVPRDSSVLQAGARHSGEPALAVRPEVHAAAPEAAETQAEDDPPPAPVLRRPGYRPYYGYGYGYGGQYGYPYPQAPRYYPNPYGGYSSQPYGGGPYYQ